MLATFAAALTFSATPLPVRLSFWALLILEEVRTLWPRAPACEAVKAAWVARAATGDSRGLPAGFAVGPADELPAPASEVVQQLTRSQATDGSELMTGFLRLSFAPMQRTAVAHVAFCPPFPRARDWNSSNVKAPRGA